MLSFQNSPETVDSKTLFQDPRYFVFDTLPKQNLTRFLVTTESELSDAPFTDIRFDHRSRQDVFANSTQLLKYAQRHRRSAIKACFIFHHAFVCSTLLARCLGQIDAFYSLKEPWIIRRIADLKRRISTSAKQRDWQKKSEMHLRLLCKPYSSGKSVVIKSTNVANNIIGDVCQWMPRTRVLYLYSDLEAFIVSNLKKTDLTRAKIPGLMETFVGDTDIVSRCQSITDFRHLSFLQTCAVIWIANLYSLKRRSEKLPPGRVVALNMDVLLQSPSTALTAVSRHFVHQPTAEDVARMTSRDVLEVHAKAAIHRPFNAQSRAQEYQLVLHANKIDIKRTLAWASPLVEHLELEPFLQEINLAGQDALPAGPETVPLDRYSVG